MNKGSPASQVGEQVKCLIDCLILLLLAHLAVDVYFL